MGASVPLALARSHRTSECDHAIITFKFSSVIFYKLWRVGRGGDGSREGVDSSKMEFRIPREQFIDCLFVCLYTGVRALAHICECTVVHGAGAFLSALSSRWHFTLALHGQALSFGNGDYVLLFIRRQRMAF